MSPCQAIRPTFGNAGIPSHGHTSLRKALFLLSSVTDFLPFIQTTMETLELPVFSLVSQECQLHHILAEHCRASRWAESTSELCQSSLSG